MTCHFTAWTETHYDNDLLLFHKIQYSSQMVPAS